MSSNRQKSEEVEEEVVMVYKQGVEVPKNVTKVIFDASIVEIPAYAFYLCTSLKEILLNEGLQMIGEAAFWECTSLTVIKLPLTVTKV